MTNKLIIAILFICITLSVSVFAYEDSSSFQSHQATKLEDSRAMDFFFFPSRIEFSDMSASWSTSSSGDSSVVISVHPVIVTDSFETTSIDTLFADISSDGGKTWSYTQFSKAEKEESVWQAELEIPEWNSEKSAPETSGAEAAAAGAATDTMKAGRPSVITTKDDNKLIVCFWAMDSLGNVTAEMFRQTKPMSEPEVRFRPLIIDPADPERTASSKNYDKSPDRDILDTSGAWVRDHLFFRMRIAGNLLQNMTVPPGYNYFIIRFIDLDTHSILTQLGKGMYQYYSVFPPSNGLLSRRESEGTPFQILYDSRNLYQLIAMIAEAKKNDQYAIVDEYEKMLLDEGLKVSLKGEVPLPIRKTVSNTGLVVRHAMDSIYWRIDADAFKKEGSFPRGLTVRFYTGYIRSLESSGIIMDDRTGYTTLYFENHIFEKDKENATSWKYISAENDTDKEDAIDPRMKNELGIRGIPLPETEESE